LSWWSACGCDFGHGRSEQAKAGLGLVGPNDRRRRADDVLANLKNEQALREATVLASGSVEVCSMAQHLACPSDA